MLALANRKGNADLRRNVLRRGYLVAILVFSHDEAAITVSRELRDH